MGDPKYDGSLTDEIGRRNEEINGGTEKRQNSSFEFERTSGREDNAIMENANNNGFEEDSLKHATKLLQGKNLRATGSRIQITSRDEVMVEEIKANPQLMEQYKDYEMLTRKNLPEQQEFVDYMREQTSVKELFEKTGLQRRQSNIGSDETKQEFSHPSIEDWEKIKPHLKEIKNKELTTLHSIEWKQDPKSMWPTPTTKGFGHASEGQTMIMRKKVEAGELTEEEAQAMMNGTTLRPPRMKQWMWPTPKASGQEKLDTLIKRKGVKAPCNTT